MQCADARLLLDQGIVPGTANSVRTTLGFHLAQCAECRSYRVASEGQHLLQTLLAKPALAPVSPGLALRSIPRSQPTRTARRAVGGALLVASAFAVVPLATGNPVQASVSIAPEQTRPAVPAQPQAVPLQTANIPLVAAAVSPMGQEAASPKRDSGGRADERLQPEEVSNQQITYWRAANVAERSAPAVADWASYAPAGATNAARSQTSAFAQAGPQQLPQQLLDLKADDAFASMPLAVGQTLFLPDDPPAPPEPPPPAVFVPAGSLPPLPSVPAAPRPQPAKSAPAKPAPKPASKPVKTVQQTSRTYTVISGDTLTAIALRVYGDASRWRSIYEANRVAIGSNPNLIRPNQKLVVPALQNQTGGAKPSERIYTVRNGDTLSAIALEFYGDGNLWPLLYSANRATIGGNPDLIFPQQRLSVPSRTQAPKPQGSTKPAPKPGSVQATGKLTYTVAKGDSLRGLAKRVYGDESRWQEIYRANRALIPDADALRIGITLVVP